MDPPTLPRALASVAKQDYPDVEVVLVAACGASHRPVDARAVPVPLDLRRPRPARLPRPRAANTGLEPRSGELITFLDHDDEFLDGHLSGLAAALAAHPDAAARIAASRSAKAASSFTDGRAPVRPRSRCTRSRTSTTRRCCSAGAPRHRRALRRGARHPRRLGLRAAALRAHAVRRTSTRRRSDGIRTSGPRAAAASATSIPAKFARPAQLRAREMGPRVPGARRALQRLVERGMAAAQRGALDEAASLLATGARRCAGRSGPLEHAGDDRPRAREHRRKARDLVRPGARRSRRRCAVLVQLRPRVRIERCPVGRPAGVCAGARPCARQQRGGAVAGAPCRREASGKRRAASLGHHLQHRPAQVRRCERELAALARSDACEIIGIHDARSLAEGYNRGLRTRRRATIVVFSHDDVDVVTPDVGERLATHLGTLRRGRHRGNATLDRRRLVSGRRSVRLHAGHLAASGDRPARCC